MEWIVRCNTESNILFISYKEWRLESSLGYIFTMAGKFSKTFTSSGSFSNI